jgi:hypothetical protein
MAGQATAEAEAPAIQSSAMPARPEAGNSCSIVFPDQCQNSASKIMIGIGTPISQRRTPRPIIPSLDFARIRCDVYCSPPAWRGATCHSTINNIHIR